VYEAGVRFYAEPVPTDALVKFVEKYGGFLPVHGRVIELGCGESRDAVFLASRGFNVLCVDVAELALIRGKGLVREERAESRVDFSVMDALHLGLRDEHFDLAVDVAFLHLIVDQDLRKRYLSDVYRILRRGGYLFSCNLASDSPMEPEDALRSASGKTIVKRFVVKGREVEVELPVIPAWPKTLEEYVHEIDGMGFEVIEAYKATVKPVGHACVVVAVKPQTSSHSGDRDLNRPRCFDVFLNYATWYK